MRFANAARVAPIGPGRPRLRARPTRKLRRVGRVVATSAGLHDQQTRPCVLAAGIVGRLHVELLQMSYDEDSTSRRKERDTHFARH